jgi:hypothetical protein
MLKLGMTHALPIMRFILNRMIAIKHLGHKVQIEPYDPKLFFLG